MKDSNVYLSVIIPAYNEGDRIIKTLHAIYDYLEDQDYTWEVLVVSDGGTANTVDVVRNVFRGHENSRVIDRKENKGKGYTVKEGMLAARGQIRLFTDADNSTDISHFDKMKPLFDKGYDVVICSREPKDAPGARQAVSQSRLKRLMGDMGNLFIQIVAVWGIRDTQCGFKAFKAEAAEKIFNQLTLNRWAFDVEILAMSKLFKYKVGIVPAYWVNDPHSSVKSSDYFKFLFQVWKVRWNLIKGVYEK